MYISGIEFFVLPHDFIIHQSHLYKEEARKQERTYNNKLYRSFREEVCFRYSMQFIMADLWNTSSANNLKRECNKISEFKKLVAQMNDMSLRLVQ
jgi:glycosyltransferase-like protein LARGE